MIINLNKHGPLDGLMQGNVHNRGSTLTSPVIVPQTLVIKPPGIPGRGHLTLHLKVTDALRLPPTGKRNREDIAIGYPAKSRSGIPTTIPFQTPQPHNMQPGETGNGYCNGMALSKKRLKAKG